MISTYFTICTLTRYNNKYNNNNNFFSYPPKEAKWALAKSIVSEFPSLKDKSSSSGCVSYINNNILTIMIIVKYFFKTL